MSGMKNKEWHLEKKVTITMLIGIAVNIGMTFWWAASIQAAINDHGRRLTIVENSTSTTAASVNQININIARMQEGQTFMTEMFKDLREDIKKSKPR